MDWKIQIKVHVRFADVDSMGHVNNAKYFTYMEQARVAYFKNFPELDFTLGNAAQGTSIILASVQCSFKSPIVLDEVIVVKIRTVEIKRSSFVMEYELIEEKTGRLVATGESVQVYFDYSRAKSLELPKELRKRFEKIEGRKFYL